MNWKVFFTRLGSAIVFAAIMMLGLLLDNPFAIFFLALFIQFLAIREFFKLMEKIYPNQYFPKWMEFIFQLIGVLIVAALSVMEYLMLMPLILMLFILLLAAVLSKKNGLFSFFAGLTALVYISVPLAFLVILRNIELAIPLALILMIWMNDTMAYIVGSFIGKRQFSPISPKKTWEGTIGGAVLTLIGTFIWSYYSNLKGFDYYVWFILALIAIVAGTAGDLFESKLKRMADVKDSGNLMPGHGGALDRFDSLLMALPFAFVFVYFFLTEA